MVSIIDKPCLTVMGEHYGGLTQRKVAVESLGCVTMAPVLCVTCIQSCPGLKHRWTVVTGIGSMPAYSSLSVWWWPQGHPPLGLQSGASIVSDLVSHSWRSRALALLACLDSEN